MKDEDLDLKYIKYFNMEHIGADILVNRKSHMCICNYCGREFVGSYAEPIVDDIVVLGDGYFSCMEHIKTKHSDILKEFELVQCDEVEVILECRNGHDEIIAFEKSKPQFVPDEDEPTERELILYSLNIGKDKLLDVIVKLNEGKDIPIEDMVIGRNSKGNYTLHYKEQC